MKHRAKCNLFFALIVVTGILGMFVFFDLPLSLQIYPATVMAILVVAKLIADAIDFKFGKEELEKNGNGNQEEIFKLEQEVRECNPYILVILSVWLAIIGIKHFNLLPSMFFMKVIEKFLMAMLMLLAILVTFSYVGTKVLKNRRLPGIKPLRKQNGSKGINK